MDNQPDIWPAGIPQVGMRAQRTRTVKSADIVKFSELSGDFNPIHYDEQVAAKTSFGRIVVQGGITTALLNALVSEDLPGPGTVFLNTNWNFKAPVHPGDTITAEMVITAVRTDKPITELDAQIRRQDGTVVLSGTAVCYTFAF